MASTRRASVTPMPTAHPSFRTAIRAAAAWSRRPCQVARSSATRRHRRRTRACNTYRARSPTRAPQTMGSHAGAARARRKPRNAASVRGARRAKRAPLRVPRPTGSRPSSCSAMAPRTVRSEPGAASTADTTSVRRRTPSTLSSVAETAHPMTCSSAEARRATRRQTVRRPSRPAPRPTPGPSRSASNATARRGRSRTGQRPRTGRGKPRSFRQDARWRLERARNSRRTVRRPDQRQHRRDC